MLYLRVFLHNHTIKVINNKTIRYNFDHVIMKKCSKMKHLQYYQTHILTYHLYDKFISDMLKVYNKSYTSNRGCVTYILNTQAICHRHSIYMSSM